MNKRLIIALLFFLFAFGAMSEDRGILPLTGIKYFKEGIQAQSIGMKIDGTPLMSNRIPFNKDIVLVLRSAQWFCRRRRQKSICRCRTGDRFAQGRNTG